MRWDALFADLELQLDAEAAQDRAALVAELTRAELTAVRLVDRLRAATGRPVTVTVRSGQCVRGVLTEVGSTWVLVLEGGREHLVPLHAVAALAGLPQGAAAADGTVVRRLGLGHALRAVARDRSVVRLACGAFTALGRIDVVAGDHLELTTVHPDSWRPAEPRHLVPLEALDLLTRV